MSAYAEVNHSGVVQKQRFNDEYTRQKTWSIAKKWHDKASHEDEGLKVPENKSDTSESLRNIPKHVYFSTVMIYYDKESF